MSRVKLTNGMSPTDIRTAVTDAIVDVHEESPLSDYGDRIQMTYNLPIRFLIAAHDLLIDRHFKPLFTLQVMARATIDLDPMKLQGRITRESAKRFVVVSAELLQEKYNYLHELPGYGKDEAIKVLRLASLMGTNEEASIIKGNVDPIAYFMKGRSANYQQVLDMLPELGTKPLVTGIL